MDLRTLEKTLAGEVFAEPTAYQTLIELCDRFGPRFAGTTGYAKAAEWVEERLRAYGLVDIHREPVAHLGWERGEAMIQVLEPYRTDFPALALPYCPPGVVEAEFVDLGPATPEVITERQEEIAGRIVLASAANPPNYPRSVHRMEKYARLVQAGAAGFLFAAGDSGQLPPTGSLANGEAGAIPGLGLSAETTAVLTRWRAAGPVRLRVGVRGGGSRPALSHNVVADLPGGPEGGPLIILCGHLDSHDIAPGADDNGSGSVAVMEAARALVAAGAELPARVRVILFAAEEVGLLGSAAYARAHANEMDSIRFVLNADCVGTAGRLMVLLQGQPELAGLFHGYLGAIEWEAEAGDHLVPYSDHFPFALAGVPSAMVVSHGNPGSRGYGHTTADTLDKVSPVRLQGTAMALARLAARIASEPEWPGRRRGPEEVREQLVGAGLEETLRLDGRWPF